MYRKGRSDCRRRLISRGTRSSRNTEKKGVTINIPVLNPDFSIDTDRTICEMEVTPGPSTAGVSCHNGPVKIEENIGSKQTKRIARQYKSLISAACQGDLEVVTQMYKEKKVDIGDDTRKAEALQNELNCAFLQAMTGRHPKIVAALLDMGASTKTYHQWYPAVMWAINMGCEEIVDIFIERGLPFRHDEYTQSTVLHTAARMGNASVMTKILNLNQVDVNTFSECNNKVTPLHVAVQHGRDDCARLLIEAGADVNAECHNRQTALHMAATRGSQSLVVRLIRNGAKVNSLDSEDKPAWFYALQFGHTSTLKLLEEHIKDSDIVGDRLSDCQTFLHLAVRCGNITAIEYLISKGCDLQAMDNNNRTVLMYAVGEAMHYMPHIIDKLLSNKACRDTINWVDDENQTALSILMNVQNFHDHHQKIASALVKAGSHVDHVLSNGETLLIHHSIHCSSKRTFLIKSGADMNFVTDNGTSLLWKVASEYPGHASRILPELLKSNIDMRLSYHVQRDTGTTPFTAALENNDLETARLLYHSGCSLNRFHEWLKSDSARAHSIDEDFRDFVAQVIKSGFSSIPQSLWVQARQATLRALGTGPVTDKAHKLGLPVMVAALMDPDAYREYNSVCWKD